ncbi:MAG TPA: glycosyltransferase [Dinghuibacter sp.]|uniref:glycosyltransferase n=1 Tax=Dinghuibacter sp. TaxID=2024697 RepID=UPI002CFDF3DC|nr:glycosyltransferase [Dinghuibacter sp.]HTJ11880.1 glycosyltransferase [Dinghuibacter sp.]
MKIVHVAEAFASGIAVFIHSLVDNMKEDQHIIIHGDRPHVMPADEVKRTFRMPNVSFMRWPSAVRNISPLKDLKAAGALYKMLKEIKNIDVVHLHSSKAGFLGRVVCRFLGIQTVIYTPNGAPFLIGKTALSNRIFKILEKTGSLFGGTVVCCSQSEWQAYTDLNIPAVKINNGIKQVQPKATITANDDFTVVTSGRIADQKNPSLFNAIARYFEEWSDISFVWVGDGDARAQLTASNIQVTGWLPQPEAKTLIQRADVYLSTARFEGLSFAGLEALHLEKPMLLTDCIGNRDMARSSNGDLFRGEGDAIIKLLRYFNNRLMLPVMGRHSARLCAQEFNINNTYHQYRRLYKSNNI